MNSVTGRQKSQIKSDMCVFVCVCSRLCMCSCFMLQIPFRECCKFDGSVPKNNFVADFAKALFSEQSKPKKIGEKDCLTFNMVNDDTKQKSERHTALIGQKFKRKKNFELFYEKKSHSFIRH